MKRENYTSLIEEIFNAISHGLGVVAGIVGFVFLMLRAHSMQDVRYFWGVLIFGVTLILLYLASTLYHSLIFTRASSIFKKLDYSAIALFIAGTYTPVALVTLKGHFGWLLLIAVWTLTLFGFIWRWVGVRKDSVSLVLYLLTGWLAIMFIKPLSEQMTLSTLVWLILGGVAYTLGTIFYRWRKLAFNHGIWHMFVLLGSICHFVTIMKISA